MYLYELSNFLNEKINNVNIHVVPWDLLPQKFDLPAGFIINTSSSGEEGSHWVSVTIDEQRVGFYMDSYGRKPTVAAICKFLDKHTKYWKFNSRQLQQEQSATCGKYSAMHIVSFSKGVRPENFIHDFTPNLYQNDEIIAKLFAKYNLS
jgi:hypothetical protein